MIQQCMMILLYSLSTRSRVYLVTQQPRIHQTFLSCTAQRTVGIIYLYLYRECKSLSLSLHFSLSLCPGHTVICVPSMAGLSFCDVTEGVDKVFLGKSCHLVVNLGTPTKCRRRPESFLNKWVQHGC